MAHTVSRIGLSFRHLITGSVLSTVLAAASVGSLSCADENDPKTHVAKLSEPATRPAAVNRLVQFFEDAMTKDKKDRNGPAVKPLLDEIVEPLTKACLSGELDEKTQTKLIKFLSDARDPRSEACLVKTLKDYRADVTDENVQWAARAIGPMKLKGASTALLEVFTKVRPSRPKASAVYRDVHDAMMELFDPAWEGQLISMIERPINDRKDIANLKDEIFWQTTAAKVLGLIKSEKAVVPLLKVLLSPTKADVHMSAILALTKIGKPAIAPTVALLNGENKDLADFSRIETIKSAGDRPSEATIKAAAEAHVASAALILATIGREEGVAPMLAAIEKADDVPRAILARELSKLPSSPEVLKAFQNAYEKTPTSLSIPPGQGAREALLDSAAHFFDPSLVPWIVSTAIDAKGDDADGLRETSLLAALKLMKADQIEEVEKLYNTSTKGADGKSSIVGKAFEKEFKLAKELLNDCKDNVSCYLTKIEEPAAQEAATQVVGIKAASMIGILGGVEGKNKLVLLMPKLKNAAVRFVAVQVIDHFSPKGDTAIATKLQQIVDENEASKDTNRIAGDAPLKQVIYRLNARAQ